MATDYISRDIAISELMPIYKSASFRNRNVFATARKCLEAIENIPAADVVERKRGKWIEEDGGGHVYCSECGEDFVLDEWAMDDFTNLLNFCPNCGADMREAHP